MGYGDDIMATAYAKMAASEHKGAKTVFGNGQTVHDPVTNRLNTHWSEVFFDNPNILQPGEASKAFVCVEDYPGHRLYVDYPACEVVDGEIIKFAWQKDFQSPKGEFHFSLQEKAAVGELIRELPMRWIVVEPNVKKDITQNKAWAFDNWQALVLRLHGEDVRVVQMAPSQDAKWLDDVTRIVTPTFREACLMLSCASGLVTAEGGLHHAAAALDVPATVLWGHYTSPDILGYHDHRNIRKSIGPGCGIRGHCKECEEAMAAITVDEVFNAVMESYTNETASA